MTAALAPYLYELCRIVLGAGELNDEKWALSEQACNPGAPAPEDADDWQKEVDAWRKRKLGIIGSSNLSHAALLDGCEWNVRLSMVDQ